MDVQLPRLTRYLRSFTNLEPRKHFIENEPVYPINRNSYEDKTPPQSQWPLLYKTIESYGCNKQSVSDNLVLLRRLTLGICNDLDLVKESSIFIFKLFMVNGNQTLKKQCTTLNQMYGFVDQDQVYKIAKVVNEILAELSDECKMALQKILLNSEEQINGNLMKEDFKNWINPWIPPDTTFLTDLNQKPSSNTILDTFSMAYTGNIAEQQLREEPKKEMYDKQWLYKEIQKCYNEDNFSGLSIDDIYESISQSILSSKSSDELQNELFDFLGYGDIELIQSMIEKRHSIALSLKLDKGKKLVLKPCNNEKEQDLVSSQQKLQRREDKPLKNMSKFTKDDDSDIYMLHRKRNNEDVKKESELKKIFSTPKETYPHVYDAIKDAQKQTGFITGVKMMLPENVCRVDNKQYEEVNIPIPPPTPLNVGNNLIPIDSLDEYGKLAFSGMKSLNRIQSVVFETAYNTNENLLICAPTGAGKTNIALLTVMHTIREHIDNGIIKKEHFKIVYVAPMKALAAEMTANFNKRLNCLGITVKELTGDMQLTKTEILQTQMLVTTPEKWDVVTRKSTGDVALSKLVKLLIIDEVHLLHGDRGPVIEALVARTLRQVETSQSMIRIVGLSATLPNYLDVARFLHVNPQVGLFYFDGRFRPVPLEQTFIGVKAIKPLQQMADMDNVCYDKVVEMVQRGHQVMVFVHARNATVRVANVLVELARQKYQLGLFQPEESSAFSAALKSFSKDRIKELGQLLCNGFSVHHAGLLRIDRNLIEKTFSNGVIKVLVCTSTLAWGVNLPAHAVIIRGTEIYDAKHGSFIDLGILDVLQIFGRAGRPQFDTSGHGTIITSHNKLSHYLSLLTNQFPIESSFINFLADNLNAEISLGTISNVDEAVEWLSYTYLFVRMRINPQVYGINYQDVIEEPTLLTKRRELIDSAAKALDKAKMIRYNSRTGSLAITDLGRTASHFYIKYNTVEVFNEMMTEVMNESEILTMVSHSQEFQQLKVREDEMGELDEILSNNCEYDVAGGKENLHGKVNILMQAYLSRKRINSFSLVSDLSYISQNAVRIMRALFEISLRSNNAILAGKFLQMALMLEHQQWNWETPLRQFSILNFDIITKLEERDLSILSIREMDSKEIGFWVRNTKVGATVKKCAFELPLVELSASLHPITRTVLRVKLTITPDFTWNVKVHGKTSETYWIWIEDPKATTICHSEYFLLTMKQVINKEPQELVMTMPLVEPLPSQYIIKVTSDRWLGCSTVLPINVQNIILPESHPPHTELLDLQPLPVTALNNPEYQTIYKFSHFNPIQTQLFHCLYHTDNNVLLGAPTGSGKTIMAEIAMLRVFTKYPNCKVVYVAPLKALVRERIEDWKLRFEEKLNRSVVELTGDVSPDIQAITNSDIIVTTPEKWDGISRSWQTRSYVQSVALIVLDEVHLLGEDRGPVLEVIVSRTNFISAHTERPLRIVALSTAIANARDLANWLGIGEMGLYNFRPSVRPVPLEVHIHGFPGKHYCPRMATMNRPIFQAISNHSPCQPTLIFVSSRRQTRLTALDLIASLAADSNPKQWLHCYEDAMDQIIKTVKDSNLRLTLAFGIGLHHAGLQHHDRKVVEELFVNQKIQVLIATSTLAWGVNLPAHLVVVKGTEYYDAKTKRYLDMPITDVLQMMGRAGRPQFDNQGIAVIFVHDVKKNFYKRFLYEPFPVESSLLKVLPDHLSAEIVAGTIKTKQEALDYLTWTYFFRRLLKNPTYYGLEALDETDVNSYLSKLVDKTLLTLFYAGCVTLHEDERTVSSTSMGRIAAYYYLSYQTMLQLHDNLEPSLSLEKCLYTMCHVYEYSELPVRHNEEILNGDLAKLCPWKVDELMLDSPHIKTYLLLQAHFSRLELPSTDYYTDLKSVLDQAIRILQGMLDVCAESGWLALSLRLQHLMQMIMQGRWLTDSPFTTLPGVEPYMAPSLHAKPKLSILPQAVIAANKGYAHVAPLFMPEMDEGQIERVYNTLKLLPILNVGLSLNGNSEEKSEIRRVSKEALKVHCDSEYTLSITLERINKSTEKYAYTPKFHKPKTEGWILTLGDIEKGELLALRRVTFSYRRTTAQLTFYTPKQSGTAVYTLYVMSDTYLGLDQQYNIVLDVEENMTNLKQLNLDSEEFE
ncbi:activating signal cointegrator 1 complex subunit 3 [Cimex lectularius]|uniref:U5 small nuclear ribonucleoprotein 200 kDa helicase n=1 Tax=Cimex lectularius TaxID=79782 RepID=A0A8I6S9X9_CIMLE|nr:activating signal cointegrator 1 complex subunit 3 [Cimex lectularius]